LDASQQVTELLSKANGGHKKALDELMRFVYEDLCRLAARQLQRQPGSGTPTLQPTELANETYLRLLKQRSRFDNSGHFFAIATKVMLRVLRDHRRAKGAAKRGGDLVA
jgi:RNA polymerase sigma factor (TIGR02999 family)